MTKLEKAKATQTEFKRGLQDGHPWVPGLAFIENPGLDLYIVAAFESYVHSCEVEEQVQPAKRVSLSDNPNWRPSAVPPMGPGSKEWVDREGDAGVADPLG